MPSTRIAYSGRVSGIACITARLLSGRSRPWLLVHSSSQACAAGHEWKEAGCLSSVPPWLAEKFEGLDDDAETRKLVAATVAAGQVQKLAKHGVDTFHFYTMNRADLVFAISHLLGIRPNGAQKAA